MGKRYYWLKLPEGFFRQKPIKKLRKIAGGDTYTIIYLKMLLIAMKQDGKIYFEGVEDDFYEELALELDEDSENVKVTVLFLIRQCLMELVAWMCRIYLHRRHADKSSNRTCAFSTGERRTGIVDYANVQDRSMGPSAVVFLTRESWME